MRLSLLAVPLLLAAGALAGERQKNGKNRQDGNGVGKGHHGAGKGHHGEKGDHRSEGEGHHGRGQSHHAKGKAKEKQKIRTPLSECCRLPRTRGD